MTETPTTAKPMPKPMPSWRTALDLGAGTAIVALFSYATIRLVPSLREPYWAPIAAVVVLYPTLEATKKAALDRFLGTLIGSIIGWASATWWHGDVLPYALSLVVAVALCALLRLETASRLCAVTITVIALIPRTVPAYVTAFHRFVEVSYGVACALAYTLVANRMAHTRTPPPSTTTD
jgi:uncharacterized membrane protein YccC